MSGKATSGGIEFQANVTAFVAVHMLARRPLRWTNSIGQDIPVISQSETGGPGDDIRVELENSARVYEGQCKRGLNADARLADAVDMMAGGLSRLPDTHGLIIVDSTSSGSVRTDLRDDLERRRQGLTATSPAMQRVDGVLALRDASGTVDRLHVIVVDLESDHSGHQAVAVEMLRDVLLDPDQAEAAWSVLVKDALAQCRQGGRRTAESLKATLGRDGIELRDASRGARVQLERLNEQSADMTAMLQTLLSRIPAPAPTDTAPANDAFANSIEAARSLIDTGEPAAALKLLRGMTGIEQRPDHERVRYLNLEAAALMRLAKTSEAVEVLSAILALSPLDRVARINRAQAALSQDDPSLAREIALSLKELHATDAWTILVQLDPESSFPREFDENPEVLTARAVARLRARNWPAAESDIRLAIVHGGRNNQRDTLLAASVYSSVFESQAPELNAAGLDEVERLLDAVLASTTDHTRSPIREEALVLRGQTARFRGDLEAALRHFVEASRQFPTPTNMCQVALVQIELERPEAALHTMEQISAEPNAQLLALRARAQLQMGASEVARKTCGRAMEMLYTDHAHREVAHLLTEVVIEGRWIAEAEELLRDFPPSEKWLADLFGARVARINADTDAAVIAFAGAVASAPDWVRHKVLSEYGLYLLECNRPAEAAAQLEGGGASSNPELQGALAQALYNAAEFGKASGLLESVEDSGAALPVWALKLGTLLSDLTDNVLASERYLTEWRTREQNRVDIALRLALIHLRLRKEDDVRTTLNELVARTDLSPAQMISAAELALRIGDAGEALRLAYNGASAAAAQPDIQLAYVNIFTQHEDDAIVQDPPYVEVNSRVLLRDRDGEKQTYFITDDARVEIRAGELAATDAVAIALVGKRVGESVVLRPGTYSELVLEIVEIRSRFVHLFQDILSNFPKRFPSSAALQAFKVEPEDNTGALSVFTRSLEDHEQSESALVDAYDKHAMPLGMLALKLGRTLVDAYGAVCSRADAPMLVEFSDAASRAKGTLDAQTGIVLTRSALVTCQHLNLLQTLSQHFAKLLVPRSLVDELLEEREGLRRYERGGYKGALSRGGQIHFVEHSPEAIQLQIVAHDELLAWVSSSCVVSPRPISALSVAQERASLIGVSSTDALALLSAVNTQLYADDLGLRRMGLAETGRIGLSTYALVEYLRSVQVLTPELADRMHASLLLLNHAAIPISPRAVFAQLQMSGFRIDKQVQFLLDRVKASDAAQADKAVFLAELLRLSALSTQGKIHLGSLALSACDVLRPAGGVPAARGLLHKAAEMRLRLLPEQQDVVLAIIERVFSRIA